MIDWQAVSAIGTVVVAGGGVLGFIAWLWRKLVPTHDLKNRIDMVGEHLRAQDVQSREQGTAIKRIEHEVFPNSGNSMRDKINQLTEDVAEMRGILETLRDFGLQIQPPRHKKEG